MSAEFQKIKEAVQRRDEFLREHPELIPLQEEIFQMLSAAGTDSKKRSRLLQERLLDTWSQITRI